jgi:hypothetical protein
MRFFFLRREHNKHIHSFKLRPDLYCTRLGKIQLQLLQQRKAQLFVSNLASAKVDSRFYLVPLVKQPGGIVLLKLVIMLVGARPELYFLDGDESLFGLGFLLFFLLFVLVLTEVDYSADRRLSLRRDLDQIQALPARDLDRLLRRHYAELIAVIIDDADFTNSNPLIDAN